MQRAPVKSAIDAMAIAKDAAEKAGFFYVEVIDTKKEDKDWVVSLRYFSRTFRVVIDSETGDVLQWSEQT